MNTHIFAILGALTLLLSTSAAAAQGAWSTEPSQTTTYTSRPVEQYQPTSSAKRQAQHRGYQGAFSLGVPIFLNVNKDVVRPGADLNFYGGFDMGYVAFGLGLGAMWTPINFYNIPEAPAGSGYGRHPMTRLYLAPEFRVQVPNRTPMLPYVGITFDANWWRVKSSDVICGWYYCTRISVFRFTPGMTAKLGFAFRVATGSYIDIGVKYSLSGPGSFFFRREQWVTPYIGMLFR